MRIFIPIVLALGARAIAKIRRSKKQQDLQAIRDGLYRIVGPGRSARGSGPAGNQAATG